ncbi:hypothetical protein FNF27_05520 [Cafeteria roenbergensis]|uniref:Uncharacterized protein n=1 Tax=Cafeteria roenbergensis TaxID=33653 RepID=A0A5A8E6C4_CAFRO|nr:hypothetical protein FNF28_01992 [Cafeteria roenbergensis]KAA0173029.1 hypothetical protein FNF27_05520 [Cafeteria roenbergensis]
MGRCGGSLGAHRTAGMRLILAAIAVLAASAFAAGRNPSAERKFLGGGMTMDRIWSKEALPFETVAIDGDKDPRMRFRGGSTASSKAAALRHRLSAFRKRSFLRSSEGGMPVLSPNMESVPSDLRTARKQLAHRHHTFEAASRAGSSMRLAETKSSSGTPLVSRMQAGVEAFKDDEMTANMHSAIAELRSSMDLETMRMYGCAPGTVIAQELDIEAPEGEGFERGRVVDYLNRYYDVSTAPTDCCTKRVRMGAGQYLPLKEYLVVMLHLAKSNGGGVMRVALNEVFPPAFDFFCSAIGGYPASVARPTYYMRSGTQLAGALARVQRSMGTMMDICTAKTVGNTIDMWAEAVEVLRNTGCFVTKAY